MNHPFSGIIVRYRRSTPVAGEPAQSTAQTHDGGKDAIAPTASVVPTPTDELHVNLWEIGGEPFLDLGVMIGDWVDCDSVQVDLPWSLDSRKVSDLGARLNGEKSIAAIFNEVVHYDGFADRNYASVCFRRDDGVDFNHFTLLRLNSTYFHLKELNLADGTSVTQLKINLPRPQTNARNQRVYVRFRIRNIPDSVYASVFRQKDRNLLSSSTETRIIDFRINVRRGVPDEVLTGDSDVHFPHFSKIHFFLTIDRGQECVFQGHTFKGCRSLVDEEIWNEYVGNDAWLSAKGNKTVRNYLGYQWTESYKSSNGSTSDSGRRGIKDLVVLGRFSKTRSSFIYIIRFLALGLLFGVAGNALWDVFQPQNQGDDSLTTVVVDHWKTLRFVGGLLFTAWLLTALSRDTIKAARVCVWSGLKKLYNHARKAGL